MGWIIDLDGAICVAPPALPERRSTVTHERPMYRRYVPRRRRRFWIARDTPILPGALAQVVWEEASVWLGQELPREWIRRLTVRADVIYGHNSRFRRSVRGKGDAGRNFLRAFMRHWLASMIQRRDYVLYTRLPADYGNGCALPNDHCRHASQPHFS